MDPLLEKYLENSIGKKSNLFGKEKYKKAYKSCSGLNRPYCRASGICVYTPVRGCRKRPSFGNQDLFDTIYKKLNS
jgi:hypothetical protein